MNRRLFVTACGVGVLSLGIAAAVALFAIRAAHSAPPPPTQTKPTTWTVTVDGRGTGNLQFSVTVDYYVDDGGCGYAKKGNLPDPSKTLTVCPIDIVQWQAITDGSTSDLYVVVADQILNDKPGAQGKPHSIFHGADGNPTESGYVGPNADQTREHDWHPILF